MRASALAVALLPPGSDWRTRILGGYFRKWVILGVLIGVVAGVGAIVFFEAIDLATQFFLGWMVGLDPPVPRGEGTPEVTHIARLWLIPIVTTVGGLISGIIVFTLAPEAEGHGTDAAIEAFHERGGKIRSRIPAIKLFASAVTIGSGGSAGREGPTAQIAAGFGSWLGDLFRLTPQDRRIAVAVGVGAGIGAIFKAPLGGAILAGEILYLRDFELEAIIPGFIASVIGYAIFALWSGWTPVFGEGLNLKFTHPEQIVWYAVLGVAAGLVGLAYVRVFYGTRDAFHKIHIPPHVKPAIGGLAVGLIGLAFPEVLSMGYGWLQFAIEGNTAQLALGTMVALVALKIIATSLTIGTGGSGGVFAPGLFIGGMLGASMWGLLHSHVPWMPDTPAPLVIVGMMALFGGVAKAPIAVMIMVAEMTGEFSMIVPAMIAVSIAYLLTGETSIYENQVSTRADSPAHRGEYTIPLVQAISVGQAMRQEVVTAAPDEPVEVVANRMSERGIHGVPVVDGDQLVGIFTETDALIAARDGKKTVADAMTGDVILAYSSDTLHVALQRMTRADISLLPVVERGRPDRLEGVISLRDLARVLDLEVSALASPDGVPTKPAADPLRAVLVREAMHSKFTSFPASLPITKAARLLSSSEEHAAVVVSDTDGAIEGIVTLHDVERAVGGELDRPISEIATRRPIVARPGQSVADVLSQPGAEGLRQLPVVEEQDGRSVAIGMIGRSDVVAAYLRARDREARLARRARLRENNEPEGMTRMEVLITDSIPAASRTLAELRLPKEALVTGLQRGGTPLIPRGDVRLLPGDRLEILTTTHARNQVERRLLGDAPG